MRKSLLLVFFIYSQSFGADKIPAVHVKAKKKFIFSSSSAPNTVISQREIVLSGATSTAQTLEELGTVQIQDITGNGSQIMLNLRGFGANASSNTLLLINGIPITNPDIMPPDLNAIPVQEIKSIEIISGSESVLYGDQAVGGTVNIVTRSGRKKQTTLTCAIGSYQQRNCYFALNNTYRELNFGLGALNKHSNNFRLHNDYDQNLMHGQILYPYSKGNLIINFQLANENMQYPGALTAAQAKTNPRQSNNNTNYFKNWNGVYQLQQTHEFLPNWSIETNLARREMHGNGVLSSSFNQSRTIHYLRPLVKGILGNTILTTGVDLEDDQYYLRSLFGVDNDSQQKYGLYGLANVVATSKLSFSVGARGAEQTNYLRTAANIHSLNRAFVTTIGTTYQLNQNVKLYLRRAGNFRFPKSDENASLPPGVKYLKTQQGVSYETGLHWLTDATATKLGIYQLNLVDEIQFDPTQTPEDPFGVNRNLDPTVRQGGFLSEKIRINEKLTLNGQYNFVLARFQSGIYAGKRIPLVSENIWRAGINYKFAEHWNQYTEVLYTGSQFSDNDNANIAGVIPGYAILNFSLRYHFKKFSAALRVNNVFDKQYFYYTVYQPSLNAKFFYPAAERNFLLTIDYKFT